MFKKGNRVIVKSWGECYTTYQKKADELGLKNYIKGRLGLNDCRDWTVDTNVYVVVKEIDGYVGIQDVNGGQYLIGRDGLELTNSKQNKVTKKQMKTAFILKDGDELTAFATRKQLEDYIDGDDCEDYEVFEVEVKRTFKIDSTPRFVETTPKVVKKAVKKTAKRA